VSKRGDDDARIGRGDNRTADLDGFNDSLSPVTLDGQLHPLDSLDSLDQPTEVGATGTGPELPRLPAGFGGGEAENTDALLAAAAAAEPPEWSVSADASRYEDRGSIGRGGVGEVRRVFDKKLQRVVAMKTLHETRTDRLSLARFHREAVVTAQLQHPAIVPIYDLGRREDGVQFYTMREVRGATLEVLIEAVHSASTTTWQASEEGWTLHRLVGVLVRVAEAVAFAHDRGAVHRDLKPTNIMVGNFGDVQLLDWGLVKVVADGVREPVDPSADKTRYGSITGTPAYMAPEQALGDLDKMGPPTDVYALGAILYGVLTGRRPYEGNLPQILHALLEGTLPPPRDRTSLPIPDELEQICLHAMADEVDDRPTATEVAARLQSWMEGAPKATEALRLVDAARLLLPRARVMRQRAAALRKKSEQMLARVPAWASEERKRGAWQLADDAEAQARDGRQLELAARRNLQQALVHDPSCLAAHRLLADAYRRDHQRAEARRDTEAAERAEDQLRTHAAELPETLAEPHHAYLQGHGRLRFTTDPPGAEVRLWRFTKKNRRLVPADDTVLGTTPIDCTLPRGSYLLVLRKKGYHVVRYPVRIGRLEEWSTTPPGADAPTPVALPRRGSLAAQEVYVPAGWFTCGDLRSDTSGPPSRVWVDGFVVGRFPVTAWAWLAFLDELVRAGRLDAAERYQPRRGLGGRPLLRRRDDGTFRLDPEGGILAQPQGPVVGVDYPSVCAFLRWRQEREGKDWRLPGELEWEKAARGVDDRLYPWGNHVDPTWARLRSSTRTRPCPAEVDTYPVDTSVYGVRGLGGNVADWCGDVWSASGPDVAAGRAVVPILRPEDTSPRNVRGGAWHATPHAAQAPGRLRAEATQVSAQVGFRLARSLDPSTGR